MHRITAISTLLLAMTVPASTALAGDGSGPLKVNGEPSKTLQLGFETPDRWSNDLPGPKLARGVYGRELPAGDATCRILVVTRGETSRSGIQRTRPRVRLRFDGGRVSFKAIERHGRWYRSSTTVDTTVTPSGWKATGAAEVLTGTSEAIVLTQASAVATADGRSVTDAERSRCAKLAPGEIKTGLQTILESVVVERR